MSCRPAVFPAVAVASLASSLVSIAGGSPLAAPRSHDSTMARVAGAELYLERRGAAQTCPDAGAVARSVARAVENPIDGRVELRVVLEHSDGKYTADMIVSGARQGARSLLVVGADCGGLANALIVTIALLLDPDAKVEALQATPGETDSGPPASLANAGVPATEPPGTNPPQEGTAGSRADATADDLTPGSAKERPWTGAAAREDRAITPAELDTSFSLGPTLTGGLLPKFALGGTAQLRVSSRGFGAELSGTWTGTQTLPFDQGAVQNQAQLAHLSLCRLATFAPGPGSDARWRAGGCASTGLARLAAAGKRYETNRQATAALWLAGLGGRLLGPLAGPLGWELRADALLPLGERSFSVDNLGPAWNTSKLMGVVSLAVQVSFP